MDASCSNAMLLLFYGNFTYIKEFTVHEFNEFSNHAPLTFSMLLNTHIGSDSEKRYCTYRWNEVHRDSFLQTISRDLHLLDEIVNSQQPVNETVELFSHYIMFKSSAIF